MVKRSLPLMEILVAQAQGWCTIGAALEVGPVPWQREIPFYDDFFLEWLS